MNDKCPNCGSPEGVYWNDSGNTFLYNQSFGGSIEEREVMTTTNKTSPVIYCRCLYCDKRFKIKDIEKELFT